MSLASRRENFARMSACFSHTKHTPLIVSHVIDRQLLWRLQVAARVYMVRSLPEASEDLLWGNDDALLNAWLVQRQQIRNVTPNGMVVPKQHLILEFNALVQAFQMVITSMGFQNLISSWHVPLNLRYKDGEAVAENTTRAYATENIHSDSWAGESAESVTVNIPLFGDVERNHLGFYEPPDAFEESWLGPRESYAQAEEIAAQYRPVTIRQEVGCIYLMDFATLHASARQPGAKARVSIDTTFTLKRRSDADDGYNGHHRAAEVIHPWRLGERMSPEDFAAIGTSRLMVFSDTLDQQVEVAQGQKHPTRMTVGKF